MSESFKVYINNEKVDPYQHRLVYTEYKAGYVGSGRSQVRYPYTRRKASEKPGDGGRYYGAIGNAGSAYYYKMDWDMSVISPRIATLMHNRLISKLEGKCGVQGSLGSSVFAEGTETVKAAVEALEGAARLVRAMRRKDLKGLKRAWRKLRRPTAAMKAAGGKWLEFSFGWAPLVSTIADAMRATGEDYPAVKIHATVREAWQGDYLSGDPYYRSYKTSKAGVQSIKAGYDVKVENPNTWLLGRLDLLNPGVWIWEAIPFSFFVDYFVNIGDVIHNLDSFAGLSLSNGYTTYYHRWSDEYYTRYGRRNPYDFLGSSEGEYIRRGGPLPLSRRLVLQQNPLTSSWQRGLNASSFLAQFLRG